jgi:hypothetical protein
VKRGSYWLIRPAMVNKNVSHVITHKPNSGLDLVVRKPKIQKVKEKKKKIIIKVENIDPNKIWIYLSTPQRMILYERTVENV